MTLLPDLTIIIPTLNEAGHLKVLLTDLSAQHQVRLQLVISDGDSTDATLREVDQALAAFRIPIRLVNGPAGRPAQINRGAALAESNWLMILHADSRLPDPLALRTALDLLMATKKRRNDSRVAGRFCLRFAQTGPTAIPELFFAEAKARLNRADCIHGDQGILLPTVWFRELGPLPEDMPMLAETRLANQALALGEMMLFPAELITSPRRFVIEGLARRQALNALIMNCAAIHWPAFFAAALPLYRPQTENQQPLPLRGILAATHQLLRREPPREHRRIWRATGAYAAANTWQLAFWLDVTRAQLKHPVATSCLHWYDHHLANAVTSPPGQWLAMLLTWCWFQTTRRTTPPP